MQNNFRIFTTELFKALLITYLCLMLLETVQPGMVSNVISLWVMIIPITILGIIIAMTEEIDIK